MIDTTFLSGGSCRRHMTPGIPVQDATLPCPGCAQHLSSLAVPYDFPAVGKFDPMAAESPIQVATWKRRKFKYPDHNVWAWVWEFLG